MAAVVIWFYGFYGTILTHLRLALLVNALKVAHTDGLFVRCSACVDHGLASSSKVPFSSLPCFVFVLRDLQRFVGSLERPHQTVSQHI